MQKKISPKVHISFNNKTAQYHPDAVSLSTMDARSQSDNASPTTQLIPVKRPASVPILSLWGFATATERIMILFAMLGSLVSGIINPLAILYLGDLLRALLTQTIDNSDAGALIFKAKQFAGLGAGAFAATYLARSLWVFTCERQILVCTKIRSQIHVGEQGEIGAKLTPKQRISLLYLEGALKKDMGWLDTAQGESLAGRLGNYIPLIKNGIGENAGSLFAVLGTMVATLAISFSSNWKLTMIILSLLHLLILVGIAIVKVNSSMVTRSGDAFARASALAEQALGGVRTVYAFSLQSRLQDEYSTALKGVESADTKKSNIAGFALGFFTSLLFLIFALSFYLAVRLKIDGDVDGSSAVTVLLSMMMLAASLMNVPSALSVLASAAAAARTVFHVIWDAQLMAPVILPDQKYQF
ncbi:hypothetical protein SpCBS45565_g05944 [Spizellomyces sp. 'palustris']|nr:hypothetical protein SpCBS45565_g05944 [Spizellomyces sp. 'palustris']